MVDTDKMNRDNVPKRITKQFYDSLSSKDKKIVDSVRKDRLKESQLKASTKYQEKHREKVNKYQNARNRRLKEERIIKEAEKILKQREMEKDI